MPADSNSSLNSSPTPINYNKNNHTLSNESTILYLEAGSPKLPQAINCPQAINSPPAINSPQDNSPQANSSRWAKAASILGISGQDVSQ